MKNRRVGTVSMGLTLVAAGVLMLVSLFTRLSVLSVFLRGWPVILVALGAEILVFVFRKKDEKISYDLLSMVFIGLFLFVSVTFYAGFLFVSSFEDEVSLTAALRLYPEYAEVREEVSFPYTDSLKISAGVTKVKVLPAEDDAIRMQYTVSSRADGRAQAEALLADMVSFSGGAHILLISDADMGKNRGVLEHPYVYCTIFLPPDKTLDLSEFAGEAVIDARLTENVQRGIPGNA